jgi:DNA-binding response OmpR family regulator
LSRILIVDDEVDLVEACTMALEREGHAVDATTDARQALASARRARPDLVMLDWIMPGADGGAVLSQLRADATTAHTPVLVVSALPDGDTRARSAGADAFLAKPFDADQLRDTVSAVLRTRRGP